VRDALGRRTAAIACPQGGEAWNTSSKVPAPLTLSCSSLPIRSVHEVFMLERRGVASREKALKQQS